ncbi:NAD(P)-dependent alcohol dehydrogenase [Salmonirosea aquatica]|uniref:Zinc-binding dehydrogenase n=1 Tax=Salmonirosea aquatica TaxID=2654236 RepID=A0A7C9FRU1_9BACT|nr:zinc-binding dehydrogenase [Cytophagaceae bacterium SJW1-29]
MKAIVYTHYGAPESLTQQEVPTPVPKAHEVLIQVEAASVNSWDWDLVTGRPRIYRLMFGLFKPRYPIIGSDIAGRVEAAGKEVTQFRPGDEVFGDISGSGFGAFAEYACAPAQVLARKVPTMTFEQAAATPQAGVLALQGLRQGQLAAGKKVLINGAGGGVGTFAVQMAKVAGAEVTGVDRADKLDLLRSLGADHVIDYREQDFTKTGQTYDLILDMVTRHSVADCRRALKPGGRYVLIGGSIMTLLQAATLGSWSKPEGKQIGLLMHKPNPKDLHELNLLFEAGSVVPVIDKTYPLHEVSEAVRYLGEGNARGKVVITI